MSMDTSKYKAYPAYKDSGVEWLGEVPAHWEVKPTKHFADFFIGWTPPTGNDAYYFGDNLWANISDIGEKVLKYTAKRISDEAVLFSRLKKSSVGSLLFSFKLSIGQVSIVGTEMFTNEAIATFPSTQNCNVSYLYWAAPIFICQNAEENIYGAKLLNQERIKNAIFAVPSILEQSAIATFLDRKTAKIDTLIAKQERLIELLQEKRTSLISHAVTKGLNPDTSMKDSGVEWLGEVPEHWEMKPIKYITSNNDDVLTEKTPENYEIEYVDISSVNDLMGITKTEEMVFKNAPSRARRLVKDGDIIVSTVRTYLKAIAAIKAPKDNLVVSTGFAVIRPKDLLIPRFAAYLFRANYLLDLIISRSVGVSYPAINASDLVSLKVGLPSLVEQSSIADFLDRETAKIDAVISKARQAIDLLKERRISLISAAVTGKIDVRGAA